MTQDIALVTGGNKGLGREIVRQLATEGLTVYLGARDKARGQAAQEELAAAEGLDIRFVQLDVTDQASVGAAARSIEADSGRLDVLVNNAGIANEWGVAVPDIDADVLRQAYEVNVFGVVTVTKAFLPLLRRSANGRIVNMSSQLGSLTQLSDQSHPRSKTGFLSYSSSKAALNALTIVYSNALRADGIKVNAAAPGLVPTDLNSAAPVPRGSRTPADGAKAPVHLALLPADGPTGTFYDAEASAPW
jgi:NAD(P)-dependent dehydrogenase (short-subunit alcohol dehydrogenase family)